MSALGCEPPRPLVLEQRDGEQVRFEDVSLFATHDRGPSRRILLTNEPGRMSAFPFPRCSVEARVRALSNGSDSSDMERVTASD